jgi:hypothetical protein
MREIPLTRGLCAIVDDSDYNWISKLKWNAIPKCTKSGFYAVGQVMLGFKNQKRTWMHREILGVRNHKKIEVDHINGNGLDNRRCNLRVCSHSQNSRNRKIQTNNKTGYKGVNVRLACTIRKYCASLNVNINYKRKCYHLGYFKTAKEAALAYNNKAKEIYGEFAKLNII